MKVWVLTKNDFDGSEILAVYKSRESAQAAARKLVGDQPVDEERYIGSDGEFWTGYWGEYEICLYEVKA